LVLATKGFVVKKKAGKENTRMLHLEMIQDYFYPECACEGKEPRIQIQIIENEDEKQSEIRKEPTSPLKPKLGEHSLLFQKEESEFVNRNSRNKVYEMQKKRKENWKNMKAKDFVKLRNPSYLDRNMRKFEREAGSLSARAGKKQNNDFSEAGGEDEERKSCTPRSPSLLKWSATANSLSADSFLKPIHTDNLNDLCRAQNTNIFLFQSLVKWQVFYIIYYIIYVCKYTLKTNFIFRIGCLLF
jgi:hypothetical protein